MAQQLPKVETPRMQEAFESYFEMGDSRSTQKVAKQYAVSHTTAKKWMTAFKWRVRVARRYEQVNKVIEKRNRDQFIRDKLAMINACRMGINDFIKRMNPEYIGKGKVAIKTAVDFERIGKMYLLLQGEATDRTENLEIKFSTGDDGEDWTAKDAMPSNGKGNGAEQAQA